MGGGGFFGKAVVEVVGVGDEGVLNFAIIKFLDFPSVFFLDVHYIFYYIMGMQERNINDIIGNKL